MQHHGHGARSRGYSDVTRVQREARPPPAGYRWADLPGALWLCSEAAQLGSGSEAEVRHHSYAACGKINARRCMCSSSMLKL